jgi:FkbM family methyltransferase
MNLNFLNRPEYWFQPTRTIRRLLNRSCMTPGSYVFIATPWTAMLRVKSAEAIGESIFRTGVYDLAMSEVLWRLTDSGDYVCDTGANIGYTASLLAARVGTHGKVICFEPHPGNFGDLINNVMSWRSDSGWNQVECRQVALSDSQGVACLRIPTTFADNSGIATLTTPKETTESIMNDTCVEVQSDTFDCFSASINKDISLWKIDVEGHEHSVLGGALQSLTTKRIRDIVYEEHDPHPAATTRLLQKHGYEVFRILKGFTRPLLVPPDSPLVQKIALSWEPANYLATTNPKRAQSRMRRNGWRCLHR